MTNPETNPIITTSFQADALSREHPGLAATMAQTAYNLTIVEQQHMDVRIAAASGSNDQELTAAVSQDEQKLKEKIDRIEFWSAVVALHPINEEYLKEKLPYQFGGGQDHVGQVQLCMRTEKEMLEDMERSGWVSPTAQNYGTFLDDVIHGVTFPEGVHPPKAESEAPELLTESPNEYYDRLRAIPGTNPVVEALNGKANLLPKAGWLITSTVKPGTTNSGVDVVRYEEGGLELRSHVGDLGDTGAMLYLRLAPSKHGEYSLSYLDKAKVANPSDYRGLTDTSRQGVIELVGGSLRGRVEPMRTRKGDVSTYARSSNMDRIIDVMNRHNVAYPVEVTRITDDPDEAKEIVQHLAGAMGMDETGALLFSNAFASKDVFKPVADETRSEAAERERLHMLHHQKVLHTNKDGSQLVDRWGDHYMIEADGTTWIQYSSMSGLMYSGPNDMHGEYPE